MCLEPKRSKALTILLSVQAFAKSQFSSKALTVREWSKTQLTRGVENITRGHRERRHWLILLYIFEAGHTVSSFGRNADSHAARDLRSR
jgi:hypothetical protein